VALFIAALAIWFVVKVLAVIILGFIAILLAVYLSAVTDQLERRFGISRPVGLTAGALATLSLVVGLAALFVPPVVDQTQALIAGLPQTLTSLQQALARLANQYPVLRATEVADPQSGLVSTVIADLTEFVRGAVIPYLRAGGTLFIDGAAVVVIALYFAARPTQYRDGVLLLVAPVHRPVAQRILDDAAMTLRAWVTGQLLVMVMLAAFTAVGLWVLGVPYWLAFGIFTGIVALVPFFGSLVSTVLPALFVMATGSWLQVIAVLALGTVVHIVGTNLFLPLVMERTVSIPPALTIIGVLIFGTLVGPVGLVIAVPVIAIALVVIRHLLQEGVYAERAAGLPAVVHTHTHTLPQTRSTA
jgi:predicted PurR-regulated permease PerM